MAYVKRVYGSSVPIETSHGAILAIGIAHVPHRRLIALAEDLVKKCSGYSLMVESFEGLTPVEAEYYRQEAAKVYRAASEEKLTLISRIVKGTVDAAAIGLEADLVLGELSADQKLLRLGLDAGYSVYRLEGPSDALRALLQIPKEHLETLARDAEDNVRENGDAIRSLLDRLFSGDWEFLENFYRNSCNRDVAHSTLCERMIRDRNEAFARAVCGNRTSATNSLVIVGGMHLLGPHSLQRKIGELCGY